MDENKKRLEPSQISLLRHIFRVYEVALENIDLDEPDGLFCDLCIIRLAFEHLQKDLTDILEQDVSI